MLLKGRYAVNETTDLIAVQCSGCGMCYLGNTGKPGDPLLDATYREIENCFVCSRCYVSPSPEGIN